MDNIIPLRVIQGNMKKLRICNLSEEEADWIKRFLIVFRNGDHIQKEAICANIKAHSINCLRKGSSK